ncbi:MAG TPA: hypothetical protein VGI45_28900 [Terracidiphilus sp.]
MRLPFRIRAERQIEVHLQAQLGLEHGRLADLVQLLARAQAIITDLEPDRTLYHVGMPERFTQVKFLVSSAKHKKEILKEFDVKGFVVRELIH